MVNTQAAIQTVASAAYTLIVLLVPLLVKLLYPQVKAWLDAQVAHAEARMTGEQLYAAQTAARLAVTAVEQMRKNGAIVDNQHAFDTASGVVQTWLASRGILLDMTVLRAAVESAVNELPHAGDAPAVPPKA